VRFGLCVPNFGEFGDPDVLVTLSRQTEAAGWDGFFLWDHIVWRRPVPLVDCWVTLGAIASATDRITIGPLVAAIPRRRPWNVARAITTLDHLAHGRTVLGVGLGAPREEFESFGEEWEQSVRADKLDEGLDVISQAWSGPIKHRGQHFRVEATFKPAPVRGTIPIWVGGYWPNKRPVQRAAAWQGFVPRRRGEGADQPPRSVTAQEFAQCVARVAEIRKENERGGEFDYVAWGETAEMTRTEALAHVDRYREGGATWWIESTSTVPGSVSTIQAVIDRGPLKH
jgi:alkanesulfonate monooxygenase SsuD/methylene tetrahydromethanopterin reductase-like flavin-dependent oxidoreductase (luciferase family)